MSGTREIFLKELSDNLMSKRFWILFIVIYAIGLFTARGAFESMSLARTMGEYAFLKLFTTAGGSSFSFLWIAIFIVPLLGAILTFDTINREIASGTLSNILSQPVHRDSVINAKFAAGIATMGLTILGVILMVTGFGVISLGALPSLDELGRIFSFFLLLMVYISVWSSLGLLFSTVFKREGTSALATVTIWLFFGFFIFLIFSVGYNSPLKYFPTILFAEGAQFILVPTTRFSGPVTYQQLYGYLVKPLPLDQSLLLCWPDFVMLISMVAVVFALAYIRFMRQEIKAI